MHEDYGQTFTSMIWQFLFKLLQELHTGFCVTRIVKEKSVIREDVFHEIWSLITMMDFRDHLGLF